MVYFIKAEGNEGLIKIGFTDQAVEKRLAALQTGSSTPLTIIGSMRGTKADEKLLHQKFHYARTRGEWFKPVPELLAFIAGEPTKPVVKWQPPPEEVIYV